MFISALVVQDKISCSQLERIASLKVALACALEVKVIKEQNKNSISQQNIKGSQNTQHFSGKR